MKELYKQWCKETNRIGGMLFSSIVYKFFDWLNDKGYVIKNKKVQEIRDKTLYVFLYNDFIHESAYSTISIHTTKKGAYKALKEHKLQEYQDWYEDRMVNGKKWDRKFAWDKDWKISIIKIND